MVAEGNQTHLIAKHYMTIIKKMLKMDNIYDISHQGNDKN